MTPITSAPVLVTGVTGYVGSQVARELLESGYRVRGTTRDPEAARQAGHLTSLPGADRLELVAADLMDPGSIDAAVAGCEYVMHVASPYELDVEDPQRDLIDPAVQGTLAVLRAAEKAGTVRRVVLTSSFAAITFGPRPGHVFTEEDWNEEATVESGAYYLSKTLAEQAAWDFVDTRDPGFDVLAINPPGILGPSLVPSVNTSAGGLVSLTDGSVPVLVDLVHPYVDVRDVALAHLRAIERSGASGRYLLCGGVVGYPHIAAIGREVVGDEYRIPKRTLDGRIGNAIARFMANFQSKEVRRFAKVNIGADYRLDTTKARTDLGLEFRDLDDTLRDAWLDLHRWGHLGKK